MLAISLVKHYTTAKKFTNHSLIYIFNTKKEEWKGHQHSWQVIKNQATQFPKARDFDYSQLLSQDGVICMDRDSYFDKELVDVIDSTTHSNMHDYNNYYKDL